MEKKVIEYKRFDLAKGYLFFLSLFFLFVPMQYRMEKILRTLKKILFKGVSDFPAFFDRSVYLTISDIFIVILLCFVLFYIKPRAKKFLISGSLKFLLFYFILILALQAFSPYKDFSFQYYKWIQLGISASIVFIIASSESLFSQAKILKCLAISTVFASVIQSIAAVIQYFSQKPIGLKYLGELNFAAQGVTPSFIAPNDGSLWIFDHIFSSGTFRILARAYGTFSDPNILAGYMVFAVMSSIYLFIKETGKKAKYLIASAIFLQIFTVVITYSRSGFFGVILGGGVFFSLLFLKLMRSRKSDFNINQRTLEIAKIKVVFAVVLSSLVLSTGLFYHQLWQRGGYINYKNTSAENSDNERKIYQDMALSSIQQNPLKGVGFNSSQFDIKKKAEEKHLPHYISHPVHNVFLLIASESGLLALGCFVLFLIHAVFSMLRRGLNEESIFLISIFIPFLGIACCSHYFFSWTSGRLMFFILMGCICLAGKSRETSKENVTLMPQRA